MKAIDHALAPGTELRSGNNTYVIRSVLGSGGFGITYSATFNARVNGIPVQAVVAIKEHFISDDCERSGSTQWVSYSAPARGRVEGSRKDFAGEARRLKSVGSGHENIVQVSEIFEANNTAYYVMEYLEGESLAAYVGRKGPLSESETLSIMNPIIEAVGYLHDNRITHLDIKPANIMLAKDQSGKMRPVLIDFGLSKHYNEDGSATSTINTRGYSEGYAPVEQYAGISTFSPASDVYSLAATLMFCLTGRTLPRSIELTPQMVESLIPTGVSARLRSALESSLRMALAQRPANGKALYELLNPHYSAKSTGPVHDTTVRVDKTEIYQQQAHTGASNQEQTITDRVTSMNDSDFKCNTDADSSKKSKRNGFVTLLLIISLIASIATGIYIFCVFENLNYITDADSVPIGGYKQGIVVTVIYLLATIVGYTAIFRSVRFGFWIFLVSSIIEMFGVIGGIDDVNAGYGNNFISECNEILPPIFLVFTLAMLCCVLWVKVGGISEWERMKKIKD